MLQLPVWLLPSCNSNIRWHLSLSALPMVKCSATKLGALVGGKLFIGFQQLLILQLPLLASAILDYRLLVTAVAIGFGFFGTLDPENGWLVVG